MTTRAIWKYSRSTLKKSTTTTQSCTRTLSLSFLVKLTSTCSRNSSKMLKHESSKTSIKRSIRLTTKEHKRISIRKLKKSKKKLMILINKALGGKHPFVSPLLKTNEKCISCNKKIDDTNDEKQEQNKPNKSKNKYLFKELYQNSQKLGGGFSRILESLDDPNDINIITATDSISKEVEECLSIPNSVTNSQSIPKVCSKIKFDKKRMNSISNNQII